MSADFAWSPSYDNEEAIDPKIHKAEFGDGYVQRTGANLNNAPSTWTLSFTKDNTVADAIRDFFKARTNGESFTWYPPGEPTNLIRVIWSQYRRRRISYNTSVISVTFTQVYGQ